MTFTPTTTDTTIQPQGWLSRLLGSGGRFRFSRRVEQQMLIGAAMGLCLATMERGKQLESIMAGNDAPAKPAYTILVPDGSGSLIVADHRLDQTQALTIKADHPVSPMLYAKTLSN